MPPPPTRCMPRTMRSWASSGGASPRQAITESTMAVDRLVDGLAHLLGRQDHRLGQAAHEVAAPDLGLDLVLHRPGRADRDLDLLRGALADGDAVLAADEGLDRGVDVERPDAHRLQGDDAAEAR